MAKIVRLTERDLTRLVKRVIKEQPENIGGIVEISKELIHLDGASSRQVEALLNNLPKEIKFLVIINSEYADFSNIDLCGFPNLLFVNLKGTENNFEEEVNCDYSMPLPSMYDFT
jgi:hypothetical protein